MRTFRRKHGSQEQRRCAVAMHKFRFWLDGSRRGLPIYSERDRAATLTAMRDEARQFPGCVPERYWKLVELRIRKQPLLTGEWD